MEAQAAHSPALRARLRRSLIQLGGLLAIALVVVGVLAMFSVWSLNRAHVDNNRVAAQAMHALNDGRSAQTLFKIQVQEWKNVLLRGADAADFKKHFQAFQDNERQVQTHLFDLARRAQALGLKAMSAEALALEKDHRGLGEQYRAALRTGHEGNWNPFAIDQDVRGIDRQLNTELDKIAEELLHHSEVRRIEAARAEEERYEALSHFLGWSIAIAVGIVGLVLWTALRRPLGHS
jgi:hypothetical protein